MRTIISTTGTFYILPEAYDVDADSYAVVRYELMDDAAMTSHDDVTPSDDGLPFILESVRREDSSFDLRLVVTRALDREVGLSATRDNSRTLLL